MCSSVNLGEHLLPHIPSDLLLFLSASLITSPPPLPFTAPYCYPCPLPRFISGLPPPLPHLHTYFCSLPSTPTTPCISPSHPSPTHPHHPLHRPCLRLRTFFHLLPVARHAVRGARGRLWLYTNNAFHANVTCVLSYNSLLYLSCCFIYYRSMTRLCACTPLLPARTTRHHARRRLCPCLRPTARTRRLPRALLPFSPFTHAAAPLPGALLPRALHAAARDTPHSVLRTRTPPAHRTALRCLRAAYTHCTFLPARTTHATAAAFLPIPCTCLLQFCMRTF